ncbi:hypothetical protein [Psychroserpens sp.]|uniref:hypothetical protein n=1 Tax=Psychroserpens sp. TaxID=2020870 RepID=UPI00385F3A4D
MKSFKYIFSLLLMLAITTSFSQCSSAQKLEKHAPIAIGEVYAQKWAAGTKKGGSGINVYIPVANNSVVLDSIFFRGQKATLDFVNGNKDVYVGQFYNEENHSQDIILSSDMYEESKNKLPPLIKEAPFELNENECVISYLKNNETLYFKISNIKIKQPLHYPSAPPSRQ